MKCNCKQIADNVNKQLIFEVCSNWFFGLKILIWHSVFELGMSQSNYHPRFFPFISPLLCYDSIWRVRTPQNVLLTIFALVRRLCHWLYRKNERRARVPNKLLFTLFRVFSPSKHWHCILKDTVFHDLKRPQNLQTMKKQIFFRHLNFRA